MSSMPEPDPYEQTATAVRRLRAALGRHGLVFPSLSPDRVPVLDRYLVDLGRVNLATAEALAAFLENGETGQSRAEGGFDRPEPVVPGPEATVLTLLRPLEDRRLAGEVCVLCGREDDHLVHAGQVRVVPLVGRPRAPSRTVVTCRSCTRDAYRTLGAVEADGGRPSSSEASSTHYSKPPDG